jgi:hypothetical protein
MSDAGKVNFAVTFGLLILVFGIQFLFDAVQVVVRTWDEDYETGLPSAGSLMRTYGFLFLGSLAAVVIGHALSRFPPRD